MKLLTKEILADFKRVGSQEEKLNLGDMEIIVKFFNPCGAGNWYATEYNPVTKVFSGWVSIFGDECDEFGEFSLEELESYKSSFGLGLERDKYFGKGRTLKEVMHA